uniref:Alginate lyase n=1 Tax=Paenibacillus sp. FPU-7 TaxID=762821 RepID=A0A5S8WF57_9BACL|nr:Chain A, alginate lyase [Paenibacillus sp. FPU-7]
MATRTISCATASCLQSALKNAKPGDDIVLAEGVTFKGSFKAEASGTASQPITIRSAGSVNPAVLSGYSTGGGYSLYVTGDYWNITGLKMTGALKGIMLDHANHVQMDGLEIYDIGDEGVHFRDGSSDNIIRNSHIYNTGLIEAGFGEGIYVGSDKGKWATYNKSADRNVISGVRIGPGVAAEHIDIKEGTVGTIVENSVFNGTGITGANYADSFIDVKGNDAVIRNNIGYRNGNSNIVDAFQVHVQVAGWGQNATFTGNTVYLDQAAPYVVNAVGDATASAAGNQRYPAGNLYQGHVNALEHHHHHH